MSAGERFFDTNVVLYLLSADARKAGIAERELSAGGVVSVQVLNEFASVAVRKFKMPMAEVREALAAVRAACTVIPVTEAVHEKGMELAGRHKLPVFDAMIVASALLGGCKILLSEDMHDGQIFERRLKIHNPFG